VKDLDKGFLAKILEAMSEELRAEFKETLKASGLRVVEIGPKDTLDTIVANSEIPPTKLFEILTQKCEEALILQDQSPYELVRKDGDKMEDIEAGCFVVLPKIMVEGTIEGAKYINVLGKVMDMSVSIGVVARIIRREIDLMRVIQGDINPELFEEHLVRMEDMAAAAVEESDAVVGGSSLRENLSEMTGIRNPDDDLKIWTKCISNWDRRHGASFDEERKNGTH